MTHYTHRELILKELDILRTCVRDILCEAFSEEFFEIVWSVGHRPAERYCWFVRCGDYEHEFWVPGRSAEEACRRFQENLGKVRFQLDQCRLNREDSH